MELRRLLFMVLIFVTFATSTLAFVISVTPSKSDYSPFNTGTWGLQRFVHRFNAVTTLDISSVPTNAVLIIVPRSELNEYESSTLLNLVEKGLTVLIFWDGNLSQGMSSLLEGLEIVPTPVRDDVYCNASPDLPIALATLRNRTMRIVLNVPVTLRVVKGSWKCFAYTSPFSYLDIDGDGEYRQGIDVIGSFPIACMRSVGLGKIVVISDPEILTNSMLVLGDNAEFLRMLIGNRSVYLDIKHLALPVYDYIKLVLMPRSLVEQELQDLASLILATASLFIVEIEVRRARLLWILIAITTIMIVVAWIVSNAFTILFLAVSMIVLAALRRFRAVPPFLLASLLCSSRTVFLVPLALTIAAFLPVAIGPAQRRWLREPLGFGTECTLRIAGILGPATIFDPTTLIFYIALIGIVLTEVQLGIGRMRKTRILILRKELQIEIGSSAPLDVLVEGSNVARIELRIEDSYSSKEGEGPILSRVEVHGRNLGFKRCVVEIYIHDRWGFSCIRRIEFVNVNVVPSTKRVFDIIERYAGERVRYVETLLAGMITGARGGKAATRARYGTGMGRVLFIELFSTIRSRRGEYIGSRFYVPGDDVKLIHWKKSVAKGQLVVKEYGSARGMIGGGVVVLDLASSCPEDFDRIVLGVVAYLTKVCSSSPASQVVLLTILVDGSLVVLRGRALDVLVSLPALFSRFRISIDYSYPSWSTDVPPNIAKAMLSSKTSLVRTYATTNQNLAENVLKTLERYGITPTMCTLIYTNAGAHRCSYIKMVLEEHGFRCETLRSYELSKQTLELLERVLRNVTALIE